MKNSEFAEACAERLETVGWHQGNYFSNPSGGLTEGLEQNLPACALGTMYAVLGSVSGWNVDVERALREEIGMSHIPTWNDARERTKDEVIDAFMSVAKKFRNEGE